MTKCSKTFPKIFISFILFMIIFSSFKITGEEVIDQEQIEFSERGLPIRYAADGSWAGAQNFKQTGDTLSQIDLLIRKMKPYAGIGGVEWDLTVEIRKDSIDGEMLASETISKESIQFDWTWINVDFDDIEVHQDDMYFIVIPPPTNVETTFGYEWGYSQTDKYDDGCFYYTIDSGENWLPIHDWDLCFKTYSPYSPLNTPPDEPFDISPADGATDIELNVELSVKVTDPDGDNMNVTFYNVLDDGNREIDTVENVISGEWANITWNGLSYNNVYNWFVKIDDGNESKNSTSWTFTTKNEIPNENNPPNIPSNPFPNNNGSDIELSTELSVKVTDPDGDNMNVTFYDASNDEEIGRHLDVVSGNRASITWDGLSQDTEYNWYVIAEDTEGNKKRGPSTESWHFTTKKPIHQTDLSINIKTLGIGRVKAEIKNEDEISLSNIEWFIKVEGGIFNRIDVSKEGEIKEIKSGKSEKISTWDIWNLKSRIKGLGRINIYVEVKVDGKTITEEANGFVIWRLVLVFNRDG